MRDLEIHIDCLGRFLIRGANGSDTGPPFKKGQEFLAYLVAYPDRVATRERLIEAFWPGLDGDTGSHRLHLAASGARTSLRPHLPDIEALEHHASGYCWNPLVRMKSDVSDFLDCGKQDSPEAMNRGLELYRGEFLAGHSGDWLMPLRMRLGSCYLTMLVRLASDAFQARNFAKSLEFALRAMDADPGYEEAAQLVMRSLIQLGRRSAALLFYASLERYLHMNVGIEPSVETARLARTLESP